MNPGLLPNVIAQKIAVNPSTGCWEWTGSLQSGAGYARINYKRRNQPAHRVVYELLCGPIPPGLQIDHLCRVRKCVNPTHLEPVTPAVNIHRGEGPSGINRRKTHCVAGHLPDGDNLLILKDGHRQCRSCRRLSKIRFNARRAPLPDHHGTTTNYGYGCRCDECRAAKAAEYQRSRLDPRKAYA